MAITKVLKLSKMNFYLEKYGKIKGLKTIDGSERKIDCSAKDVKEYEGLSYHPKT